jgi:hypothetical protein
MLPGPECGQSERDANKHDPHNHPDDGGYAYDHPAYESGK